MNYIEVAIQDSILSIQSGISPSAIKGFLVEMGFTPKRAGTIVRWASLTVLRSDPQSLMQTLQP